MTNPIPSIPAAPTAELDHLVIAARTLDEGVQWCEATLGARPSGGGAHPLMGTHNRLLDVAGPGYPRCYLEVIAVDPQARPQREPPLRRWFDLDDEALQAAIAQQGPSLIHFVARVPDAAAVLDALAREPVRIDRGHLLRASRQTPEGLLEWQMSVRDDGQRLFYGALPTVIEWGERHAHDQIARSDVVLESIEATHPRNDALRLALDAIGLSALPVQAGPPGLAATLRTPRGLVTLRSNGI